MLKQKRNQKNRSLSLVAALSGALVMSACSSTHELYPVGVKSSTLVRGTWTPPQQEEEATPPVVETPQGLLVETDGGEHVLLAERCIPIFEQKQTELKSAFEVDPAVELLSSITSYLTPQQRDNLEVWEAVIDGRVGDVMGKVDPNSKSYETARRGIEAVYQRAFYEFQKANEPGSVYSPSRTYPVGPEGSFEMSYGPHGFRPTEPGFTTLGDLFPVRSDALPAEFSNISKIYLSTNFDQSKFRVSVVMKMQIGASSDQGPNSKTIVSTIDGQPHSIEHYVLSKLDPSCEIVQDLRDPAVE